MSFSLIFPKSDKAAFPAAVDAAVEAPPQTTAKGQALVSTLKEAAKSLANQFDGDLPIAGTASGHVCEDGVSGTDSAAVGVYEQIT